MGKSFSVLEKTILKSKGATDKILKKFAKLEITSKESFAIVGDAQTLSDITGLTIDDATAIMKWAGVLQGESDNVSNSTSNENNGQAPIVVDDASTVRCTHCEHKQPKDYKMGDLCPNCGKQAEPISNCYWCYTAGSGKYCRGCGAEHVKNLDYEIALLLKKEGVSKRDIIKELETMDDSEKQSRLAQLRTGRY